MDTRTGDWRIWDFVDSRGVNIIKQWGLTLSHEAQAKLDEKLDKLRLNGMDLYPGLLSGVTNFKHLYKLRVRGGVQLRPLLSKGPVSFDTEFTILSGATERGGRLKPKGVENRAERNRLIVRQDPSRRCGHEWLGEEA